MYLMEYLIFYDIPSEEVYFKKKINKMLRKINAKIIQRSIWKSENLTELIKIATLIKNIGGKAKIVEEKVVFE
jgi:CRISPR/Cas system-associated endoribonuclease Cas2